MTPATPARQPSRVDYPESDGKPVARSDREPIAESDVHRRELLSAIQTLQERFQECEDVYISGNLLLHYEEGIPSAVVVPDVFFVRGVPRHDRRTYKLWEEGVPPQLVIELSSRSTRHEDLGLKRSIYRDLGVVEYFLFDPLAEHLKPALQGFRRGDEDFMTLVPDKEGRLYSQTLGLWLSAVGERLRFIDPETDEVLPTPAERADLEAARAEAADARADQEAARAEAADARAEAADARAEAEAKARQRAEAELARLRAQLGAAASATNDAGGSGSREEP